jgi:hypothetical protein
VRDREVLLPLERERAGIGGILVERHLAGHVRLGRVERDVFDFLELLEQLLTLRSQLALDGPQRLAVEGRFRRAS